MEFIAPPLNAVLFFRMKISNGVSVRGALSEYLMSESDSFSNELLYWFRQYEQNPNYQYSSEYFFRKQIVVALERGLRGEPVDGILADLEREMIDVTKEDVMVHIDRLPTLMMIPMIVFQLPGFLLILVFPILSQLFETFGIL